MPKPSEEQNGDCSWQDSGVSPMNKLQIEQLLRQEGFTPKEISVISHNAEKDAYPYPWLLSQLSKRFVVSAILLLILFAGFIFTLSNDTQENLVSYSITFLIGFGILYVFVQLKPAYKAFRFMRKHSQLLNNG
jgi:hypothetical protein